MGNQVIEKYVKIITNLNRDMVRGPAPHKPLFLLTLIDLIENSLNPTNRFTYSDELVKGFKGNWTLLVDEKSIKAPINPFYHLGNEPLWDVLMKDGSIYYTKNDKKRKIRGKKELNNRVAYGKISDDLFMILKEVDNRAFFKSLILETYFPNAIISYWLGKEPPRVIKDTKESILYGESIGHNKFYESVVRRRIRGVVFPSVLREIYDNTCSFSKLKITPNKRIRYPLIENCHIKDYATYGDDSVNNGIVLCSNLHKAFDSGLIGISDDYKVIVNFDKFSESDSIYNLAAINGEKLKLPDDDKFHPHLKNIQWHRKYKLYS